MLHRFHRADKSKKKVTYESRCTFFDKSLTVFSSGRFIFEPSPPGQSFAPQYVMLIVVFVLFSNPCFSIVELMTLPQI
jgi:hypothetical protein